MLFVFWLKFDSRVSCRQPESRCAQPLFTFFSLSSIYQRNNQQTWHTPLLLFACLYQYIEYMCICFHIVKVFAGVCIHIYMHGHTVCSCGGFVANPQTELPVIRARVTQAALWSRKVNILWNTLSPLVKLLEAIHHEKMTWKKDRLGSTGKVVLLPSEWRWSSNCSVKVNHFFVSHRTKKKSRACVVSCNSRILQNEVCASRLRQC